MSRTEVLAEMAYILRDHYPHPVFGCECMLQTTDSQLDVDRTPVLGQPWEQHIAELMLEAAKGF